MFSKLARLQPKEQPVQEQVSKPVLTVVEPLTVEEVQQVEENIVEALESGNYEVVDAGLTSEPEETVVEEADDLDPFVKVALGVLESILDRLEEMDASDVRRFETLVELQKINNSIQKENKS